MHFTPPSSTRTKGNARYGILFTSKGKRTKRPEALPEPTRGTAADRSTIATLGGDTILLKSPRGREEIQTRAHGLASLARRLLIMADGRHTVSDLARELARDPGDPALLETLRQLVDGRYLHISDEYDANARGRRPRPAGA